MKVLIIPEDQTHDQFIVRPVVEAIVEDLGLRASVQVLPEPRLRGSGQALDEELVRSIVRANPMVDLFVLAVDRDCDREGNDGRAAQRASEHPGKLLACVARQEVEVWMLALHRDRLGVGFTDVRAECDPKERFAEQLLDDLGNRDGPGAGRKAAMRQLAGNLRGLLAVCDELARLREDIEAWASAR